MNYIIQLVHKFPPKIIAIPMLILLGNIDVFKKNTVISPNGVLSGI